MRGALHIQTTVLPGSRIEITAPELTEGEPVEVFLVLPGNGQHQPKKSMLEFLDSLPPGPRLFKSAAEVDRYLEEERNSWDR
jgi:hypothetical protein